MIRNILKLYYFFIDRWKHFGKHSELFVKVLGTGTSLEVLRVLSDWTQHRLCNINAICNVFCFRYLSCSALLMKTSWTAGTQNLVMVAAIVSSWIGSGIIFAIKPKSLKICISCDILNTNYLPVICWELWACSIFNKIINLIDFSALILSHIS